MNRLSYIILIFVFPIVGFSQNCEKQLQDAQRAYYNGNLQQVISSLSNCLAAGQLDHEDEEDALKLIINSHLILNQDSLADDYMAKLLKNYPLLRIRSTDLVQFKRLYESYEIHPKFNIGVKAGFNIQDYEIMQYRSYASFREEPKDYSSIMAPSLGIHGEYSFLKNLSVGMDVLYQNHQLSFSEVLLDLQELKVKESMHYIHIPLFLKYTVQTKSVNLFLSAGLSSQFVWSSKADLTLLELNRDFPPPIFGNSGQIESYVLTNQRNRINFSYIFGAGIKKQFGFTAVELGVYYDYGLNNLANEQERYNDEFLLKEFSYVSDDFKMNHYRCLIGVYRTIFKSNKR